MQRVAIAVIAKEPVPGRVKTRLSPPLSARQAADVASAALLDTLDVIAGTPALRRVLVFDGDGEAWRPDGFDLIPQRGAGLADRLSAAFEDLGGPALLVGMDTPQLTPRLLLEGLRALETPRVDAVLGPALDGGYWSVGLKHGAAGVFDGIAMSAPTTCAEQRARLRALGMRVHPQPSLRDVDTIADARAVARVAPRSRFAAALASATA